MTKADIVREIVKATGIDYRDVETILDATLMTIKKKVKAGHRIEIRGFGVFTSKIHAEKKGRRPVKGNDLSESEVITVPAQRKPHFKPSKKYFACTT